MPILHLIFLVLAFVLFLLDGLGVVITARIKLTPLGLAFLVLALWLHA